MIVLCVPMKLWDSTRVALRLHAPGAIIKKLRTDDIEEPWNTYSEYWRSAEDDLLIVEQDIVIHEDVIPQFEACPEPWCLFPFPHYSQPDGELMTTGIGCNRFRREFLEQVTVEDVEAQGGNCIRCEGNPKCWAHLDGRTREAGEAKGFKIHVHYPPVGHRV